MESLNVFNKDALKILHQNKLLLLIIKTELTSQAIENIDPPQSLIESQLKELWKNLKVTNEEEFDTWLNSKKLEKSFVLGKLTEEFRIQKLSVDKFGNKVDAHFIKRKEHLDQVVYSLIRLKDTNQAKELYYRILEGESDFGDVAKSFSEGPEKLTRGIVGPMPLLQAHPYMAKLLRSSQPGELRKPKIIDGWSIIVRLEVLQSAKLDEEMRIRLARELFESWIEEQASSKVDQILSKID